MIAMSRKRGYSEETIIETATVNTSEREQDQREQQPGRIGVTPNASRKTSTATRFSPRLNRLVSTTASGITSAGTASCAPRPPGDDRGHGGAGRLLEEAEEHDVEEQQHRIVRHLVADPEDLGEDGEQDAEQHQRPAIDHR